jgi:hypothetical protein
MYAAARRFFAPDGDNSRVIRALRVTELAVPQGESAIFKAEREWTEANWIKYRGRKRRASNISSSGVRAKVRAKTGLGAR